MRKSLEIRLQKKLPGLWSLLNSKAKNNLPNGILEYLNKKNYKRRAWQALEVPEQYINDLIAICGIQMVGNAYRRDLSAVGNENAFMDILHEIVICASLGKLISDIKLRPLSGKRARCDIFLKVDNLEIYGEVKRWPDNWWINTKKPRSRLILKASPGEVNKNNCNPRSMDQIGRASCRERV